MIIHYPLFGVVGLTILAADKVSAWQIMQTLINEVLKKYDLGLNSLPVSPLLDARHKWINNKESDLRYYKGRAQKAGCIAYIAYER